MAATNSTQLGDTSHALHHDKQADTVGNIRGGLFRGICVWWIPTSRRSYHIRCDGSILAAREPDTEPDTFGSLDGATDNARHSER